MVPVVSQSSSARPFQTCRLRKAGSVKLRPLCPGSIPTTLPSSGSDGGTVGAAALGLLTVGGGGSAYALAVPQPVAAAATAASSAAPAIRVLPRRRGITAAS